MSTYKLQYTSGSATATTDLGDAIMGIRNDTASTQLNPTNLAYGFYAVDASGRVFVTGNLGVTGSISALPATSTALNADGIGGTISGQSVASFTFIKTSGADTWQRWQSVPSGGTASAVGTGLPMVASFFQRTDAPITVNDTFFATPRIDGNRNVIVTASASWPITGTVSATATVSGQVSATAHQDGIWGVTASAVTASAEVYKAGTWVITAVATAVSGQVSATAHQDGIWGVTASAVTASANVDSDTYTVASTRGMGAFALASSTVLVYTGSAMRPLQMDLNGNLRITATASWPVTLAATTVTAVQNSTVWGVTASAVSAVVSAEGKEAHGAAGTTNPFRVALKAAAFSKDFSSASNITAGDASAVNWYGTRTGIPFTLGGGPDMQTVWMQPTATTSNFKIVDVAAGTKIVVLGAGVSLASTATTGVAFRLAFPSASGATGLNPVAVTTADNLTANVPILAHANIPAGGGITRGDGGGIVAVGGDGFDIYGTWTAPTNGGLDFWISYIRVPS